MALAAAKLGLLRLRRKLGAPVKPSRRLNSQIVRRRGPSGIHGVQRVIDRRTKPWRKYWKATWSPELGRSVRKMFSIRKYGEKRAKELAIRARRAGLRKMVD